MTEVLSAVSLVFGFYLGWLLRTVFVMAAISRQQDRMQRIVLYWQSEAKYARKVAEDRKRRLAAILGSITLTEDPYGPSDESDDAWHDPRDGRR
jgi:hypothetical protein